MAKLNTNGNVYTIVYATVIVIIVAFLLAFVASALKPTQDANVAIDKKQQILASLNIRGVEKSATDAKYAEVITEAPVFEAKSTNVIDGLDGFKVDSKEFKEKRPLYIANIDGETKYIVPMTGAGLWGGIWGYVALNEDCETVFGTYFSHESETAGLGARITEEWFQTSFNGKKLYADGDTKTIALSVVKKGKEGTLSEANYVNGVTGATLTSNGVNEMIQKSLANYQDILDTYKK